MSSPKKFSPNFWDKHQMNFENRLKWFFETPRTGLQILVESKLLVLALSNMAQNDAREFYFIIHEFTSNFFSKFGIRDPLSFANWSKWYSETRQTGFQILVESKL